MATNGHLPPLVYGIVLQSIPRPGRATQGKDKKQTFYWKISVEFSIQALTEIKVWMIIKCSRARERELLCCVACLQVVELFLLLQSMF